MPVHQIRIRTAVGIPDRKQAHVADVLEGGWAPPPEDAGGLHVDADGRRPFETRAALLPDGRHKFKHPREVLILPSEVWSEQGLH